MNITRIATTVVLLFIFLTGCQNDLLDTYPKDQLSSANFWKTKTDAVNAVNALYSFLPGYSEVDWDRMSDIATTNSPAQSTVSIERGEHDASFGYFISKWDGGYKAIRAANYLLENIDRVKAEDTSLDDATLNRLKGEARFIRAFFYLRLTSLFGDVPLITQTLDIDQAAAVSRTPQAQVWDFIGDELTAIADDLPGAYTGSDLGRITKGAALALKARAMLYAGRWDEAAAAAKAVMDLNVYEIHASFPDLFMYDGQHNEEVIFDRQFAKDIENHDFFDTHAPVSLNGRVGISPSRVLADAYQTVNGLAIADDPAFDPMDPYADRDPRLGFTLFIPTFSDAVPGDMLFNDQVYDPRPQSNTGDEVEVDFFRTKTGFSIKKYINEEDMSDRKNGGTNFILIRYADVLLMYAEAKTEAGQIDQSVYDAINEVRQRPGVNMPAITTGKSEDELRAIVRHERMTELALEGLRFFDIRRWRIAEDVMQGAIPGMNYVPVGGTDIATLNYNGVTRSFDPDRDYLFPIPQEERALNPNLSQNDGY